MGPDRIPRLLSGRPGLSRVEKDPIFDAIVRQLEPRRRRRRTWLYASTVAVAAACVLLVMLARRDREPSFLARGGATPRAAVAVRCGPGPAARCQHGATLAFDLTGTTGYGYVAAFARHVSGKVIWYLPDSDTTWSTRIADHTVDGILATGVVLGDEHPAGQYRVYVLLSHEPWTRAEIRDRFSPDRDSLGDGTVIVTRDLEIP